MKYNIFCITPELHDSNIEYKVNTSAAFSDLIFITCLNQFLFSLRYNTQNPCHKEEGFLFWLQVLEVSEPSPLAPGRNGLVDRSVEKGTQVTEKEGRSQRRTPRGHPVGSGPQRPASSWLHLCQLTQGLNW